MVAIIAIAHGLLKTHGLTLYILEGSLSIIQRSFTKPFLNVNGGNWIFESTPNLFCQK